MIKSMQDCFELMRCYTKFKKTYKIICSKDFQRNVSFIIGGFVIFISAAWAIFTFAYGQDIAKPTSSQLVKVGNNNGIVVGNNSTVKNFKQVINENSQVSAQNNSLGRLSNQYGGSTYLLNKPVLDLEVSNIACKPMGVSRVKILNQVEGKYGITWVLVKVLTGNCRGKTGWISGENFHLI